MRLSVILLCVLAWSSSSALAAGHAFSANFSVLTPPKGTPAEAQAYAEKVLQQAEVFRRELAVEWFGAEMTQGMGRTVINVSFTKEDSALTWPMEGPRERCHVVYLSTPPEAEITSSLKHEMVHVLLATRFPRTRPLPDWLEEGIASRYDDGHRIEHRKKLLAKHVRSGRPLSIQKMINNERVAPADELSYTLAESLVEYLLSRGDKAKLMQFAESLNGDLARALSQHYQIASVQELDREWRAWVTRR